VVTDAIFQTGLYADVDCSCTQTKLPLTGMLRLFIVHAVEALQKELMDDKQGTFYMHCSHWHQYQASVSPDDGTTA